MLELGAENVLDYLRDTGQLPPDEIATAELLAWGVSNAVILIRPADGEAFVIKQSRGQLRTETPWFSNLDRIWREMDVMQTLADRLPAGSVPRVLFPDRENYLFAMEAVPEHVVWKEELLAGRADPKIALTAGELLATMHAATAGDEELKDRWGDREVFVQLRVDPFYRHVARVHPDLDDPLERLIDEMFDTQVCLAHADFSPKNLLITAAGVTLVDYETGHYGDPAFDIGFLVSHLLLKTVLYTGRCDEYLGLAEEFWSRYRELTAELPELNNAEFERRSVRHLAGCMLARIDGTSTIDYLPKASQQDFVRVYCRGLLMGPEIDVRSAFDEFRTALESTNFKDE